MGDHNRKASVGLLALFVLAACPPARSEAPTHPPKPSQRPKRPASAQATDTSAKPYEPGPAHRALLSELKAQRISEQTLAAMAKVPRHEFVPDPVRGRAYENRPLPIGADQTISQPYIVAKMTDLAQLQASSSVLEVGTGSGYQAAVLAEVVQRVHSIEIVPALARRARTTLDRLGYGHRIRTKVGDGYAGWPEHAPFDAILVTAAPPQVPEPLKAQLAVGGRLVIPVGDRTQQLRVITRTEDGFDDRSVFPVLFVPMTGRAQQLESDGGAEP